MLLLRFPSIWQNFFLSIWVIFYSYVQIPGQITRPSIDMTKIIKGKSYKDFKKVVPICGNSSYNSQLLKFWGVWGVICLKKLRHQFMPFFSKIQNPGQITRPSIAMMVVLKAKSDMDFKKVVPICGNPSYNSQCLLFWRNLTQKMPENQRY